MSTAEMPSGLRSRTALARGDWLVLLALLALALAPLLGMLVRVWTKGGVVTGADGFLVTDPMQYLNWLRQSSQSGAAANLYDFAPSNHTFVHPGLFISGLLHRLGDRPLPVLVTTLVVGLLVVPGTLYRVDQLRGAVNAGRQAFFLEPGERDAMRWLERQPGPGGVLAPVADGAYISAYTGRPVWIGAGSWTPNFAARELAVEAFFSRSASLAIDRKLLKSSGARFVYASCRVDAAIDAKLTQLANGQVRRFGCARVWEVRPPAGGWR